MEWLNEKEEFNDLTAVSNISDISPDAKGFCVLRVCATKKNCSDYVCIVLLT